LTAGNISVGISWTPVVRCGAFYGNGCPHNTLI